MMCKLILRLLRLLLLKHGRFVSGACACLINPREKLGSSPKWPAVHSRGDQGLVDFRAFLEGRCCEINQGKVVASTTSRITLGLRGESCALLWKHLLESLICSSAAARKEAACQPPSRPKHGASLTRDRCHNGVVQSQSWLRIQGHGVLVSKWSGGCLCTHVQPVLAVLRSVIVLPELLCRECEHVDGELKSSETHEQ